MFQKILVPTDGSEFSLAAARRVISFAKEAGAKVVALNVKPEYPISYYSAAEFDSDQLKSPVQFDEDSEKQAQKVLSEIQNLCEEAGVDCTKVTKAGGTVYKAILETATECACDLIFMAKHGRHGVGALLMGSETNKVLTHSKIPVLVYR